MAARREKALAKADKISKNPGEFYRVTFWEKTIQNGGKASRENQNSGQNVDLNTENKFIHEDTNLRFHSFAKIWFDYEKKKQTNVNKAIRNENTTTTTHLQDLQAPRDIVKRN